MYLKTLLIFFIKQLLKKKNFFNVKNIFKYYKFNLKQTFNLFSFKSIFQSFLSGKSEKSVLQLFRYYHIKSTFAKATLKSTRGGRTTLGTQVGSWPTITNYIFSFYFFIFNLSF
jgi:hypothetical protein